MGSWFINLFHITGYWMISLFSTYLKYHFHLLLNFHIYRKQFGGHFIWIYVYLDLFWGISLLIAKYPFRTIGAISNNVWVGLLSYIIHQQSVIYSKKCFTFVYTDLWLFKEENSYIIYSFMYTYIWKIIYMKIV